MKIEPDEMMISFDVVSLFTSIPLDTGKTYRRRTTNKQQFMASQNGTKQGLTYLNFFTSVLSTEFSFRNSYYRQISGNTHGLPSLQFPC